MFAAGGAKWRADIPIMLKDRSGGHGNAVTVGMLKGEAKPGPGGYWGTVEFFDPAVIPEVTKAVYLLDKKAVRPSVDLSPEYTVEVVPHPTRVNEKAARFTDYTVIGITLVPMPAFDQVHLSADKESERSLLAAAGVDISHVAYFDINKAAWDAWPLAPREYKYDADDAVKRIAAWSGIGTKQPSLDHYASAFLWRDGNQTGDSLAQDSFRLPLCDIINGQPHLIYHAVYAAAALLSGAHGGLPNIPEPDREAMKPVINTIYAKMAQVFGDSGMKSPFLEGVRAPQEAAMDTEEDCGCEETVTASVAFAAPPKASAFGNPGLMQPTPLTVEGDRVYGHLGTWGVCHVGIGDKCVMLPKSRTDYQMFKNGTVVLDDGRTIKVGKITLGTGHAHPQYGIVPAREHYDNTGWAVAAVNVGEDKFGVWVNGVITRPEKADELRLSPLSGDWRNFKGNLELVAALAVNNPGFPVFNTQNGEEFSLVAAGVLTFGSDEKVETVDQEDDTAFAEKVARLDEIDAKRQEGLKAKRAGQLEEIDGQRQEAAASGVSPTLAASIARQMDCKFVVMPEDAEVDDGEDEETEEPAEAAPAQPAAQPTAQPAQPVATQPVPTE